jgi:hypothetical protein
MAKIAWGVKLQKNLNALAKSSFFLEKTFAKEPLFRHFYGLYG